MPQHQQRRRPPNQLQGMRQHQSGGSSDQMSASQFLFEQQRTNQGFVDDDLEDSDGEACMRGDSSGHRCSHQQHAHSHSHSAGSGGNPQLPTQQQVSPLSIAYQLLPLAPCLLLVVLKLLQSHSSGLLIFCGLYVAYFYANSHLLWLASALRREARTYQRRIGAVWLAVAMAASVAAVLYYYRNISLWRCLCCLPPLMPNGGPLDLWTLAFVLVTTDLLLKMGLISTKATVILVTTRPGASRLVRCRIFIALERMYHLYRLLPPVLPWMAVLTDGFADNRIYCTILTVLYSLCKLWHAWRVVSISLPPLRLALFSRDLGVIGGRVSLQQQQQQQQTTVNATGLEGVCPLCQEAPMERPVRLACCTHVFCEDCVMRWLSCAGAARVCPLCRVGFATLPAMAAAAAAAATNGDTEADPLKYMNGSTCIGLQLY